MKKFFRLLLVSAFGVVLIGGSCFGMDDGVQKIVPLIEKAWANNCQEDDYFGLIEIEFTFGDYFCDSMHDDKTCCDIVKKINLMLVNATCEITKIEVKNKRFFIKIKEKELVVEKEPVEEEPVSVENDKDSGFTGNVWTASWDVPHCNLTVNSRRDEFESRRKKSQKNILNLFPRIYRSFSKK